MAYSQTALNLRYLLWKNDVPSDQWNVQLAAWADCTPERAASLLQSATLLPEEQERIAAVTGVEEQAIQFSHLLADNSVDILHANLSYLLNSLEHGGKKDLAENIDVNQATISKWLNKTNQPSTSNLMAIANYFGIASPTILRKELLFLDPSPTTAKQQQQWLQNQIEQINPDLLKQLFPALRRLLSK